MATAQNLVETAEALQRRREIDAVDPITKFFDCKIPQQLWHYTTLSALEGILGSNALWATDARHTRDPSEFVHIHNLANAYLSKLRPASEHEEKSLRDASDLVRYEFETGALAAKTSQVFIASFSAARDLKSQWVGYAQSGHGVSIAFDLRRVRPPKNSLIAVTLAPCVYREDQLKPLLEACLEHFLNAANSARKCSSDLAWLKDQRDGWLRTCRIFGSVPRDEEFLKLRNEIFETQLRSNLALTQFDLLRLASHCKNAYYSEEREWRLALPRRLDKPLTTLTVQHRGATGEIPYISHDLFSGGRLPITELMAGPFCSPETIKLISRDLGYSVPVTQSASPERRAEP